MTAFLLLSDLLGNFVRSADLGTGAHVFATIILEDCFTDRIVMSTPRLVYNTAFDL